MMLCSILKTLKIVFIDSVLLFSIISHSLCDIKETRIGKFWKNISSANHVWNTGLAPRSGIPGVYFDYGAIPYGVNYPPRTYLPPLEWPDYAGGYQYPTPNPPITWSQPPIYLPPKITTTTTEFTLPEVIDAKKTIFTPNINNIMRDSKQSFDKPNGNQWSGSNVYQDNHNEPVKINEMQCDSGVEGYLRATLLWTGRDQNVNPVFEDLQRAHFGSDSCILNVEHVDGAARIHLDLTSSVFTACGINKCSDTDQNEYLCARLRFPSIEGMKLVDDIMLTLRCRIQEPLVFHTKRIDLPVNDAVEGKSLGAVATGGASNEMHCQLDVLRRGPSSALFSTRLEPGAQVLLGEELLVRLTVAEGDGWQFSRLSEMFVSGGSEEKRVTLLTSDGCLAAGATAICSQQPRRESPLSHSLIIRAPMFQSSTSGSHIQLTVRVVACRRVHTCTTHCARVARSLHRNQHTYTPTSFQESINQQINHKINTTRSYKNHSVTGDEVYNYFNNRNNNSKTDNEYYTELPAHFKNDLEDVTNLGIPKDNNDELETGSQNMNATNFEEMRKSYVHLHNIDLFKRDLGSNSRTKRGAKLTADSVATLMFTVVQPTYPASNKTVVKSKGLNDKPIAMIIALSGLISVLMLAVGLAHFYSKHRQTKEIFW